MGTSRCQLTRFQVWPPQNMPPEGAALHAQSQFGPFIAIVES
jgi:hypothetical protein